MDPVIEYGICRLSIVPVRSEGNDAAEMVSQLLFGDHYSVDKWSDNQKWVRIIIHYDGYVGWIDHRQHTQISEAYFEQINSSDYKICLDETATLLYNKHPMTIVRGSILPISSSELFKMEEQLAFNGEAKNLGDRKQTDFLIEWAHKYLNTPYLWGGRSPFGIDCSGFTQIIYRMTGWPLPRDASQQIKEGMPVTDFNEILPGDLAFFNNPEGLITHVGIMLGKKEIIHASGQVRVDKFNENGIMDFETGRQTHHLYSLRRIIRN